MTEDHKHRVVRLRKSGVAYRLLTLTLTTSRDLDRVDRSPFVWGPHAGCPMEDCYMLRPLGVLHAVTGLTVDTGTGPWA